MSKMKTKDLIVYVIAFLVSAFFGFLSKIPKETAIEVLLESGTKSRKQAEVFYKELRRDYPFFSMEFWDFDWKAFFVILVIILGGYHLILKKK